jgi:preprotein translocase subunit SecF
VTFGGSMMLMVVAILLWAVMGLNFGIDFRGGTTIRTEATQPVDVGAYRAALARWILATWRSPRCSTRPSRRPARRAGPHPGAGRRRGGDPRVIAEVEAALQAVDPDHLPVGRIGRPEGLGRADLEGDPAMVAAALRRSCLHLAAVRMAVRVGAVIALVHDVFMTIGIFALFQIKFDLAIIAAC